MSNLYNYMKEKYPEETEKLKAKFPNMASFSKEIEIIPWNDEFATADKNPEVLDQIKFLEELLKNELISEEKYKEEIRKLPYASKTLAAAFIQKKQVSFRERHPEFSTILHELGHIFFRTFDLEWNQSYGGGEVLLHLSLKEKINLNEESINKFMRIYRLIYFMFSKNAEQIAKIIGKNIKEGLEKLGFTDFPEHPIALELMGGTLPTIKFLKGKEEFYKEWKAEKVDQLIKEEIVKFEPKSLKSRLLTFISVSLQDGIIYQDPFLSNYAKAFFSKIDKIEKEVLETINPHIKNIENIEKNASTTTEAGLLIALGLPEEKLLNPEILSQEIREEISNFLPIDSNEVIIGIFPGYPSITFTKETKERMKDYLIKNPELELPEFVKNVLRENGIIKQNNKVEGL